MPILTEKVDNVALGNEVRDLNAMVFTYPYKSLKQNVAYLEFNNQRGKYLYIIFALFYLYP